MDHLFTSNTHAIALLESEIGREEKALADEEAELERLQNNMKNTELIRRKQAKNIHFLAQEFLSDTTQLNPTTTSIQPSEKTFVLTTSPEKDPSLAPIVTQLNSHLNSMHNAAKQTHGIDNALRKTQAAMDILVNQRMMMGKDTG
ncbi:MAG: hypothetical protein Q9227_000899 [Pyrenula ochraceoflavens]